MPRYVSAKRHYCTNDVTNLARRCIRAVRDRFPRSMYRQHRTFFTHLCYLTLFPTYHHVRVLIPILEPVPIHSIPDPIMALVSDFQIYLAIGLIGLLLLAQITRTVYSVYFGPLAKFPGPKLAAATLWYEFYYDMYLKGQYTFKIKELHGKYGKVLIHLSHHL